MVLLSSLQSLLTSTRTLLLQNRNQLVNGQSKKVVANFKPTKQDPAHHVFTTLNENKNTFRYQLTAWYA